MTTNALTLGRDDPLSLDVLIQQWLHASYQRTHSHDTVRAYGPRLWAFRRYLNGMAGVDLDDPREDVIAATAQAWAAGESSGHEGGTFNAYLSGLSSFYNHCILMGYVRPIDEREMGNPIRKVRRARVERHGRGARPLEPAEVAKAWAGIDRSTPKGLRDYALLTLYFATGRRATEISGMLMSDVHREGESVTLTYQRLKGGKTRIDVLERAAIPALVEWMTYRSATWPTTPSSALWPSLSAKTRDHDTPMVYQHVRAVLMRSFGVSKLHATRKTFARQALREGATVVEIMGLLGHGDLSVTTRYVEDLEVRGNRVGGALVAALGIGG